MTACPAVDVFAATDDFLVMPIDLVSLLTFCAFVIIGAEGPFDSRLLTTGTDFSDLSFVAIFFGCVVPGAESVLGGLGNPNRVEREPYLRNHIIYFEMERKGLAK